MKKELVLSLLGLFLLIGIVSAAGCLEIEGRSATICDGSSTNVNLNPDHLLFCEYGEGFSSWVNITRTYPVVPSYTLLPLQDALIVDGEGGSINPCCPVSSAYDSGECTDSVINFCWNYTTSDACTQNVVVGTAEKSFKDSLGDKYDGFCANPKVSDDWDEDGITCFNETDYCKCIWIPTAPEGKQCQHSSFTKKVCDDGSITDISNCQYEIDKWDESGCESGGYIKGSWKATWIGTGTAPATCQNIDNDEIPCDVVTKLGFFSWFNVIFVIFGIAGMYFLKKN